MLLGANGYAETSGHVAVGFAEAIRGPEQNVQGFVASFVTLELLEESYLDMNQVVQAGPTMLPVEYLVVNREGAVLIDSRLHEGGHAHPSYGIGFSSAAP